MSLLGMEFFAWKIYDENGQTLRVNFNDFLNGMVTIFIFLTNEEWNNIMIDYIRSIDSYLPVIYFCIVVIIGNFILLKLFLAILINNFAIASKEVKKKFEFTHSSTKGFDNFFKKLKNSFIVIFFLINFFYNNNPLDKIL